MILSRYNQFTLIDPSHFCVFNPLSGAFDIAQEQEKERLEKGKPLNSEEKNYWISRGYCFDNLESEENYIQKRFNEYLHESQNNPTQFIFIPNYSCNFHCSYCYQKGIEKETQSLQPIQIDAFIHHVVSFRNQSQKEVFVTLFGGEPLLPKNRENIQYLIHRLNENNIELSVVSNGFYLEEYLGLLQQAKIREIQVTLDGDRNLHNQRRFERSGDNSFDRILHGVKKAVQFSLPIHVRIIADRETLPTFPQLARTLNQEGLLDLDSSLFKTSLGRNYELIERYHENLLYSLKDMFFEYALLMKSEPLIKKLHTPSFFGITKLIETQEMYLPNFDSCPAAKHEFVFDSKGFIYGCTASCGREGYELGTYYPEMIWDEAALKEWQNRSIMTIPECRKCSLGVICGGGCGVIAKEQNGSVISPNCKAVKEVMDTGIDFYKETILKTSESCSNQSVPTPILIKASTCCQPIKKLEL